MVVEQAGIHLDDKEPIWELSELEQFKVQSALFAIDAAKKAFAEQWQQIREAYDLPERSYYDPQTGGVYEAPNG